MCGNKLFVNNILTMKDFKRTLVTAALPYANGGVHIGHLAGVYVPADIYVRYLRLKNRPHREYAKAGRAAFCLKKSRLIRAGLLPTETGALISDKSKAQGAKKRKNPKNRPFPSTERITNRRSIFLKRTRRPPTRREKIMKSARR